MPPKPFAIARVHFPFGPKRTEMPRGNKSQIMTIQMPSLDSSTSAIEEEARRALRPIAVNRHETGALEQLHDALLLKLMSGELDVSEMDLPE